MSAANINFGVLGFARQPIKSFDARTDAGYFTPEARCLVFLPAPFASAFSLCAYTTEGCIYS